MITAHQRSWWNLDDARVHPASAVLAALAVVGIVVVSTVLELWFLPLVVSAGVAVVFLGIRRPEL